ncbi:uncharacterized [Tachysurus ichikawai]
MTSPNPGLRLNSSFPRSNVMCAFESRLSLAAYFSSPKRSPPTSLLPEMVMWSTSAKAACHIELNVPREEEVETT